MQNLTPEKHSIFYRCSDFFLSQIGYLIPKNRNAVKQNKLSKIIMCVNLLIFLFSCISSATLGGMSFFINILLTLLIILLTYISHTNIINAMYANVIVIDNSLNDQNSDAWSPYGTRLLLYLVLSVHSCTVLIYRLVCGELLIWHLNITMFFIQFLDNLINFLVAYYNAELINYKNKFMSNV